MVAQVVVDLKKLFTNVYVGLPGFVNDQRVLCCSWLWQQVGHSGLMSTDSGYQEEVTSDLLGDKGYPLLSWIMHLELQGPWKTIVFHMFSIG
jgi:hypothetical protein